jgi:hypothetical protein
VTGTSLTGEMARVASALELTAVELAEIALNGFARGFAPPALLEPLHDEARRAWDAWRRGSIS